MYCPAQLFNTRQWDRLVVVQLADAPERLKTAVLTHMHVHTHTRFTTLARGI